LRCFFNLTNGEQVLRDDVGVEITCPNELEAEILNALKGVQQGDGFDARDWKGWRLDVIDSSGDILVSLRLDGFPN
jgi:hypothetical protein